MEQTQINSKAKTAGRAVKPNRGLPGKRSFLGKLYNAFGMLATRYYAKLSYRGQENIPAEAPYVIAANHQTYVDGMLIASGLPKAHFKHFSALAGSDLGTDHGAMGKVILEVARPIKVERYGNPVRGLIMAKNACQAGNIVLVHPEGTRTHDGKLGPLQNGASYIALKCPALLLPVYIEGGYNVFPRHNKRPQRRNPQTGKRNAVTIVYGKPFDPASFNSADELTAALEAWLKAREQDYLSRS